MKQTYCPHCGSWKYKINPFYWHGGQKFICEKCGREFDEPSEIRRMQIKPE